MHSEEDPPPGSAADEHLPHDAHYYNLAAELQRARELAEQTRQAYRANKLEREENREQTAQVRQQSEALRLEMGKLRAKLTVKQGVITLLLPFYPFPITTKLRQAIDL